MSFPRCAGRLSKGKNTQDLGNPASAGETLAKFIIRAFLSSLCPIDRGGFSQERMTYFPEDSKVVYRSKDGKEEKIFDTLEWLAAMCSHVQNKGEQMVRYYVLWLLQQRIQGQTEKTRPV